MGLRIIHSLKTAREIIGIKDASLRRSLMYLVVYFISLGQSAYASDLGSSATLVEQARQTKGTVKIDGQVVDYTATAGTLLLRTAEGEPKAEVFYVAYVKDGDVRTNRPITFLWSGGPGGASFAPNVAGFGPLHVELTKDKMPPLAPYKLSPNSSSLLDVTDLVFIDPVGTGYSHALGASKNQDFWGLEQDATGMADAIMRYIDQENRWQSPKFIWGVSYGTARAAMLSNLLQNRAVPLNGVMLVASVLNFGSYSFGLDHNFIVNLPTMAAVAHFHGKAGKDAASLESFLDEARQFAWTDYSLALSKGNRLSPDDRRAVAQRLSKFIGIDAGFIENTNLRVSIVRFRKELLRDRGLVLSRTDGRLTGADFDNVGEEPETDPAMLYKLIFPSVTAFRSDLLTTFNYRENRPYVLFNEKAIRLWDWTHHLPQTAGISQNEIEDHNIFPMTAYPGAELAAAMRNNPRLKVYMANGYYDFATPLGMAEFDVSHMTYSDDVIKRISMKYYEGGHSIYMDNAVLIKMKADIAKFIKDALL